MKKSHWNNPKSSEAGCAALTSADLQDPVFSAQVKLLRRHYSDANWRIGIYYGANEAYTPSTRPTRTLCLAPTSIECYLPTAGLTADGSDIGVQYSPSQECYLSRFERMSVAYTGGLTGDSARKLGRCAQYASICSRQ